MMELQDKVAVVTGGSRGIGRAIALALGGAGARVAVTCTQQRQAAEEVVAALKEMGSEGRVYQFDVADFEAVSRAFDQIVGDFGGLDEHRDFVGQDFRKAPVYGDEMIRRACAVAQLARAKLAHERSVAREHTEMAEDAGCFHFIDIFVHDDARGRHDLELDTGCVCHELRRRHLLGGLLDFVDPARHVERLLGNVVELAVYDAFEPAHRVFELHVAPRTAGELLRDVERL